jgi:hypothetical protein
MAIQEQVSRKISCDNPKGCEKSISFPLPPGDMQPQQQQQMMAAVFNQPENAWLKGLRLLETSDGRRLAYCSDVCEISGIQSGQHNRPEPKAIVEANAATMHQATAAADAEKKSNENLKSGAGGPIVLG